MRIRRLAVAVCCVVLLGLHCGSAPATEVDVEPPQVVSVSPANGAQDVDPGLDELRVVFSKQMRDESWSWVQEDPATFPELTGQPHYEDGGTVCVLPVRLEPGTSYVIWLNSAQFKNFMSEAGNALAPYRWTFRTAGQ